MSEENTIRIDNHISSIGLSSRRKVEEFLKHHNVSVNGKRVVKPGERFDPQKDQLTIDGKVPESTKLVYYAVYKPLRYVSTVADEWGRKSVISLVPDSERVFPVGRLDIDSEGLIVLTNDGELTYLLTHPRFHVSKTYQLLIKSNVSDKHLDMLRQGVRLKDGKTSPALVEKISTKSDLTMLEMTIYEGRNRQIRRMCKAINLDLVALKRIAIGPLQVGDMKPGQSRLLTPEEVATLWKAAKSAQELHVRSGAK